MLYEIPSFLELRLWTLILNIAIRLTRNRLCVFSMEMDQTPGFMTRGTGKLPGTFFTVMSVGWVVGTKYTSKSCKVRHLCHSANTRGFKYTPHCSQVLWFSDHKCPTFPQIYVIYVQNAIYKTYFLFSLFIFSQTICTHNFKSSCCSFLKIKKFQKWIEISRCNNTIHLQNKMGRANSGKQANIFMGVL